MKDVYKRQCLTCSIYIVLPYICLLYTSSFAKICGEAKCVDLNVTGDWMRNTWPEIRRSYKDEDIFNGDEAGIFYKLTPDKTFKFKNEKCVGGKRCV